MPKLVATGNEPDQGWEKVLPAGDVTLGRDPGKNTLATPWDFLVSGRHAELSWRDGKLLVRRLDSARNPIFFQGRQVEKLDSFALAPGEEFRIGETKFTLVPDPVRTIAPEADLPTPNHEVTLRSEELDQISFGDADYRIEVLSTLPKVIRKAPSEDELGQEVLAVLLRGIPNAAAAGVVEVVDGEECALRLRSKRGRSPGPVPLEPSRRLVWEAVRRYRGPRLHVWAPGALEPEGYTPGLSHDWAFCVPLLDDASSGLAFYIAGKTQSGPGGIGAEGGLPVTEGQRLQSDVKFAALVAEVFEALRQLLRLQARDAKLRQFLSPALRAALVGRDIGEVLAPRQAEVTVLFCDIRGSCGVAEGCGGDLAEVWNQIGEALDIMTAGITSHDGVIGDFQGDAAMGFWGWPLDTDDRVEHAARAALNIRRGFLRAAQRPNAPSPLQSGIGIASGPAFAGQLGTYDQAKVSIYGPRVNLASRLESLTKTFMVPILIDDHTTKLLEARGRLPWVRLRRVATILPLGIKEAIDVSELLPSADDPGTLTERGRRDYETALDAFNSGEWERARNLLERLPTDGPSMFLREFMARRGNAPPADWDGVVRMASK